MDDSEALFFAPQNSNFPLLSIDLPPNPIAALGTLFNLHDDELRVFFDLTDCLPRIIPSILPSVEAKFTKTALVNCAKECLKHANPYIKCIGFELLMACAGAFKLVPKEGESSSVIDPMLLTVLISYLPCILASNPKTSTLILNGMRTLFLYSPFATHTDYYLAAFNDKLEISLQQEFSKTSRPSLFIELYQTNCITLASTHDETLCKISKDLFSLTYIKRLAPSLKEMDQIEIGFSSIFRFLPEKVLLAIEAFKMLETENKTFRTLPSKSLQGIDKQKIHLQLIIALIDQNFIQLAKEQLLKSLEDKILVHHSSETTEIWLSLLNKALQDTLFGHKGTVELWRTMQKFGKLQKTHSIQYIDFMINLIQLLCGLQNCPYYEFISELQVAIKSLIPSSEQQTRINLLLINDLQANSALNAKRLKISYQVLEKTDPIWFENAKMDYLSITLHWLRAAQNNSELLEEFTVLLTHLLRNINNRLSIKEVICDNIEVSEILTNFLKSSASERRSLTKEFKNLIVTVNSKITDILQMSSQVDLLFEYLSELNYHNLLDKNSIAFFNQSLWLADEILIKDKKNSIKLQNLHKLIKASFQKDFDALQLNEYKKLLPIRFATALLKHQLYVQAKEWIEITIEMQKSSLLSGTDLAMIFGLWCNSFLIQHQIHYSFSLFSIMCSLPNCPSDIVKAQLCFNISKGLLKEKSNASAQLLLDHWPLLTRAIFSPELQELLKNAIEMVLTSNAPGREKLFASLLPLHIPGDPNFLLIQVQNFCKIVKFPEITSSVEIKNSEIYKILTSTFFLSSFETWNDKDEHENELNCNYILIKFLINNRQSTHFGITLLNEFLAKKLNVVMHTPQKNIKMWVNLCYITHLSWFNDPEFKLFCKFTDTFNSLFSLQRYLIPQLQNSENLFYERNLELAEIRNCLFSQPNIIETSIDKFSQRIHMHTLDDDWLDVSTSFLVDNISTQYVNSRDHSWLLEMHHRIITILKKHSVQGLLQFLIHTAELHLKSKLYGSQIRAVFMYLIGQCLESLTEIENLNAQKDVKKVVSLVETFLYSRPIPLYGWYVETTLDGEFKKRVKGEDFVDSSSVISKSTTLSLTKDYCNSSDTPPLPVASK